MAKSEVPIVVDVDAVREYLEQNDIVEVVRCKDCRWYDHICWRVEASNREFMEDDFCSYGERRE